MHPYISMGMPCALTVHGLITRNMSPSPLITCSASQLLHQNVSTVAPVNLVALSFLSFYLVKIPSLLLQVVVHIMQFNQEFKILTKRLCISCEQLMRVESAVVLQSFY